VNVKTEESTLLLTTHTLKLVNSVTSDVSLVPPLKLTVLNVPEKDFQLQIVVVLMENMMTILTLNVHFVDVTV
jgi:hypothetical protein